MPPLQETLAPAALEDVLELDELWSFVARRDNKRWVWLALCRRTRQIVAYAVGDRSRKTCRLLWGRVPRALRHALTFTDFWEAYQKVVPEGQHVACESPVTRAAARPAMWSVSTTRSASAWLGSCDRRSRSASRR